MNTVTKILLVILALTGALIAYTLSDRGEEAIPTASERPAGGGEGAAPEVAARDACRDFILHSLNDPAAAELSDDEGWEVNKRPEGTFEVFVTGQMKDTLGEMIDARWECVVLSSAAGVRLITLTVLETE